MLRMQTMNGSPVDGAGFHQSWFPVTPSRELGGGVVIGVDLLASRVGVRRDATGKPIV
jgi:phenylpropionate dioxygenase-like ring-hydroxylating dioxygenase large terminal subunit